MGYLATLLGWNLRENIFLLNGSELSLLAGTNEVTGNDFEKLFEKTVCVLCVKLCR